MIRISLFLAATLLIVQIASTTPPNQKYPIKLDPIEKVGDSYHLETTVSESTRSNVTVAGQFLQKTEDGVKIQFSADCTIEAVANNWATRKRCKVFSSTITKSSETARSVVPEGTIVVASVVDGRTVFEVDGKPSDEQTASALRSVIALHTASIGDDDMFGTPNPKAFGESWSIGTDAAKKLIKEMGANSEPRQITGLSKLEKVEDNHIVVSSSVHIQDVPLTIAPQITPGNGEIKTEYRGRIPISQSDPARAVEGTIFMLRVGTAANENGQQVKVEVIYESKSWYETSPITSKH